MLFAVDQQQYLQGYLPIVFLKLFIDERQHRRRRPARPDRPGLRGQEQRGDRGEAGGGRDALMSSDPASAATSSSQAAAASPPPQPAGDERLANISPLQRALRRPEIGALLAAVVVAIFFWTQNTLFLTLDGISNWTDVASTIGIPAVVVALLMIGGEFDLSAGVMTGSAGLMMGILATKVGMNIWLAIVLTLIAASASASSTATWSCGPSCRASSSRWPRSSSCRASTSA